MYVPSAEIASELLDLSTVDVTTLRAVDPASLEAGIQRIRARLANSEGSISGFSGSHWTGTSELRERSEGHGG